jgi:8-oxo-dGTP pyrophosphatase MutT (NUDIX family)
VPFRLGGDGAEFLLIRRLGDEWWSVPKGRLAPGDTIADTAAAEAYEEAGVHGTMGSAPLGSYQYRKTVRGLPGPSQLVEVVLFPLQVEIESGRWPEMVIRQRRWFDQRLAPLFVAPGPLRDLLALFDPRPGHRQSSRRPEWDNALQLRQGRCARD